ncbi:MAG: hypothetical protein QOF32_978 [Gammaproteobacteria bacterium]|nr:hypothetical protein [Gammaproteobacteria bacterium]
MVYIGIKIENEQDVGGRALPGQPILGPARWSNEVDLEWVERHFK